MTPHPFINRWSPPVIAHRWRHLFWSLPLLASLIGGGSEWHAYQRSIEARGVVQRGDSTVITMTEIQDLMRSDEVIQEAASRSGYLKEWNADSAEELRKIIDSQEITDSSLLAITIKGRNTPAKADLCDWLPVLAAKKAEEIRAREITDAEAALAVLNKAYKENSERFRQYLLTGLNAPQEPFVPTPEYLESRGKFEESEKALETARNAYVDLRFKGAVSGTPIIVIESCWIGGSVLLAVLLAYVLEWRFPRKSSRLDPGHPGNLVAAAKT